MFQLAFEIALDEGDAGAGCEVAAGPADHAVATRRGEQPQAGGDPPGHSAAGGAGDGRDDVGGNEPARAEPGLGRQFREAASERRHEEADEVSPPEVGDLHQVGEAILRVPQEVPGEPGHQEPAQQLEPGPGDGEGDAEGEANPPHPDAGQPEGDRKVHRHVEGESRPGTVHVGVPEAHPLQGGDPEHQAAEVRRPVHPPGGTFQPGEDSEGGQAGPGEEAKVDGGERGPHQQAGSQAEQQPAPERRRLRTTLGDDFFERVRFRFPGRRGGLDRRGQLNGHSATPSQQSLPSPGDTLDGPRRRGLHPNQSGLVAHAPARTLSHSVPAGQSQLPGTSQGPPATLGESQVLPAVHGSRHACSN